MNKIERVLAAARGEEADRSAFFAWHPFGLEHMKGESLAAAAIAYAAEYQVDLLRLAASDLFPLPPQLSLDRSADLTRIEPAPGTSKVWLQRLVAWEQFRRLAGEKLLGCESVPNPWSILRRLGAVELVQSSGEDYRRHALEAICETLCNYVEAVLEAGANAIALEVEGASHDWMSEADYQQWGLPYDQKILDAARDASFRILHVRGDRTQLKILLQLPAELLQWSLYRCGPSLEKVKALWPRGVVGGLDETRFAHMSFEALRRHCREARFSDYEIVAPGDVLPSTVAPRQLEVLKHAFVKVRV